MCKHNIIARCILCIVLFFSATTACFSKKNGSSFAIKKSPMQLLQEMTLREKLGQMNQLAIGDITTGLHKDSPSGQRIAAGEVGSVLNVKGRERIMALQKLAVEQSRLHIPLLVGMDVIHGYETLFPIPLGIASTWDMEAVEQCARYAAHEATSDGIAWTFSPMVDICIDPRWGRQAEGAGEDPYLGSKVAEAMVRGYQGDNLKAPHSILACVKHFALYGAAESGRDYNTVDMSRLRMYNQYFPPYKAAVQAGAGSVMSSFNVVDYVPATANKWLLTDVLRKEWRFKGMVVTDYASINEMERHGMGERKYNAANALKAGTDMEMVSEAFFQTFEESLHDGTITMADIDSAVYRILLIKEKLGLFENPYKYLEESTKYHAPKDFARKVTAESFVLLKNQDNLLPLEKEGTIALIGPLSETRTDISGTWSVAQTPEKYLTLREGLEQMIAKSQKPKAKGQSPFRLLCAQGCNLVDSKQVQDAVATGHNTTPIPWIDSEKAMQEAMDIARQSDVIICAMGECAWMSGEGASRTDLSMPAPQRRLLEKLITLGKPIILLNFSGRATVLTWEQQHLPAIMNVWFGSECASAVADVLFGDAEPGGRLTVSMPKATGQVPLYYNQLNTGRHIADDHPEYVIFNSNYLDVTNGPLYPFGYGLGYTTFDVSPISYDGSKASVTVTNTGSREGSTVVQLYIHDIAASISRPIRELKGFQRITLQPGKSQVITFDITKDMLSFYGSDLRYTFEPGDFDLYIGFDSHTENKTRITVQ